MKPAGYNAVSWVLVLMAASSLLSMIGLLQIDRIVHQELYNYNLRFSYQWAVPYWAFMKFLFALGWVNIIAAIAFQSYLIVNKRREAKLSEILHERVEEPLKQAKPTETHPTEPKEQAETVNESETREKKEMPAAVEGAQSEAQAQTQSTGSEQAQEQKKQEPKPSVEPEADQKETQSETQERDEETPIIAGLAPEELAPIIEEKQQ